MRGRRQASAVALKFRSLGACFYLDGTEGEALLRSSARHQAPRCEQQCYCSTVVAHGECKQLWGNAIHMYRDRDGEDEPGDLATIYIILNN